MRDTTTPRLRRMLEQSIRRLNLDGARRAAEGLLASGKSLNSPVPSPISGGVSPLSLTAIAGATSIAELLISLGVDVNARGRYEALPTPLHQAVLYQRVAIVSAIIRAGADVNACAPWEGKADFGPLHTAVSTGMNIMPIQSLQVASELLNAGADPCWIPTGAPSHYLTPFQIAVEYRHKEAIELMASRSRADLEQRTLDGRTIFELRTPTPEREEFNQWLRSILASHSIARAITATPDSSASLDDDAPEHTLGNQPFGPL